MASSSSLLPSRPFGKRKEPAFLTSQLCVEWTLLGLRSNPLQTRLLVLFECFERIFSLLWIGSHGVKALLAYSYEKKGLKNSKDTCLSLNSSWNVRCQPISRRCYLKKSEQQRSRRRNSRAHEGKALTSSPACLQQNCVLRMCVCVCGRNMTRAKNLTYYVIWASGDGKIYTCL